MMIERSFSFAAAAAVALLLAMPPIAAQNEKPQASGKFEGKDWFFDAAGAYAFPAKVGMDDEPGVRVAISNSGFLTEGMDRYWDREHVIDEFHRDEETLVVWLHFAK